jgi:hypothetical protein
VRIDKCYRSSVVRVAYRHNKPPRPNGPGFPKLGPYFWWSEIQMQNNRTRLVKALEAN